MKRLKFLFDYYFGFMFYNGYQTHRYHKYMYHTYGEKYCTRQEYEQYLKSLERDM